MISYIFITLLGVMYGKGRSGRMQTVKIGTWEILVVGVGTVRHVNNSVQ